MVAPQTVTLPAPSKSDHVAVLRADPDVSFIHVFPQDDDSKEIDSGLVTTVTVDGKSRSECWVSASALENADRLSIDTQSGQDLEAVSIDVEYRGGKHDSRNVFASGNRTGGRIRRLLTGSS